MAGNSSFGLVEETQKWMLLLAQDVRNILEGLFWSSFSRMAGAKAQTEEQPPAISMTDIAACVMALHLLLSYAL